METEHLTGIISGVYASFANPYVKKFEEMTNATVKFIAYPTLGEPLDTSGRFSGCYGLLQDGKVDAVIGPSTYPSPVVNITQGLLLYDTRVGYMASFPPVKYAEFDFARTFESFDVATWFTIACYLVVIRLFIWMKHKVMGTDAPDRLQTVDDRVEDTFQVIAHFSTDAEIGYHGVTMKVMYMVLTLFSFFILNEYDNQCNTGLVVSVPPRILEDYDDLKRYKVKPLFMKNAIDYRYFKFAPESSEERKLWNWAVKRWGEDNLFIDASPIALIGNAVRVGAFKSVCIAESIVLEWVRSTICNIYPKSEAKLNGVVDMYNATYGDLEVKHNGFDHQIYFKYSPALSVQLKQWAVGSESPYREAFIELTTRLLEYGHTVYGYRSFSESNLAADVLPGVLGPDLPEKLDLRENCLHQTPVDQDREADEMSFVTIGSLKTCFGIYAITIALSFVRLMYERFEHSVLVRKRHRFRKAIRMTMNNNSNKREGDGGKWMTIDKVTTIPLRSHSRAEGHTQLIPATGVATPIPARGSSR